jgi:CheY-like chemotaxis protein
MKKITCIAIDDEPLALTIIERFCQRCGLMDLSCYTDPGTGLNAIKNEKPDLVFLDIEMNGISGLEIAKNSLQKANLSSLPHTCNLPSTDSIWMPWIFCISLLHTNAFRKL